MVKSTRETWRILLSLLRYAVGVFALVYFFFPILWLFKASFNKPIDAITLPPVWIFEPTMANYVSIFSEEPFAGFLLNSLIVGAGAALAALAIGLPAAYAFARFEFRRKTDLAFWILSIFMFPPMASILPYLILLKHLRLVDTHLGLFLAHLSFLLPLAIWLLQRFIRDVPFDFEEAAIVDGAGILQRIRKVVIPLIAPGIAATGVFLFIFSWNDFAFGLVLAPMSAKTLPVASVSLSGWAYINWGKISAACMVITGPIFILLFLVRRYLVRGFTFGLK